MAACLALPCPAAPPCCPVLPCRLQADLLLSRLASSCRQSDPQLLSELRGELLYMARVIEEPVSWYLIVCCFAL